MPQLNPKTNESIVNYVNELRSKYELTWIEWNKLVNEFIRRSPKKKREINDRDDPTRWSKLHRDSVHSDQWWDELYFIAVDIGQQLKSIAARKFQPVGITIYENRFDDQYLNDLLGLLKNAEETAIDREKTYDGVVYKKCIEINFAGLAATTLFGRKENSEAGKKVVKAFRELIANDNLEKLNNPKDTDKDKIYVRIRILMSYPFSDYPYCLMKAELPDNWREENNELIYDFNVSEPINELEFLDSSIYKAQKDTLKSIVRILESDGKNEESRLVLGRPEKAPNTIQIRFNAIPSPLCTLIINDHTAICDSYLYAKKEVDQTYLSLDFPIVMFDKDRSAYNYVKQNFFYLWRHDISIYDSDATYVNQNKKDVWQGLKGLMTYKFPEDIDWKNKEERINDKRKKAPKGVRKMPESKVDIKKWRENLNLKLEMCTRKYKLDIASKRKKS